MSKTEITPFVEFPAITSKIQWMGVIPEGKEEVDNHYLIEFTTNLTKVENDKTLTVPYTLSFNIPANLIPQKGNIKAHLPIKDRARVTLDFLNACVAFSDQCDWTKAEEIEEVKNEVKKVKA